MKTKFLEKFEFYKEKEGERIVKEKTIEWVEKKELIEEIIKVVSNKNGYKQIVVRWRGNKNTWSCTLRTSKIALKDTKDNETACLSFEYIDKGYLVEGYWIMKVEKPTKEKENKKIEEIRTGIREVKIKTKPEEEKNK